MFLDALVYVSTLSVVFFPDCLSLWVILFVFDLHQFHEKWYSATLASERQAWGETTSLFRTLTETCPLCFHVNEPRTVPFFKSTFTETFLFPCKWNQGLSLFWVNFYWHFPFVFPCKWTKDDHSFKSTFTDTFLLYFHVNEPRTDTLLSQLLLTLSYFYVNKPRIIPL